MEKFLELMDLAKRKITIADHMLTLTYTLVHDPKLLLVVMENIFLAMTNAMTSMLEYERLFKRIPAYQDNFESKFNIFRLKLVDRYKIDNKYALMLNELKETILQHKKSPVEFARKDKLVICDQEYQMKSISFESIKHYIAEAKIFLEIARKFTSREGLYIKEIK